jgi:hypothetical protein
VVALVVITSFGLLELVVASLPLLGSLFDNDDISDARHTFDDDMKLVVTVFLTTLN